MMLVNLTPLPLVIDVIIAVQKGFSLLDDHGRPWLCLMPDA
jgi:hypothetical protein